MLKSKTAFITGITGQDGSYLAEQLLEKGYDVHGLVQRQPSFVDRQYIENLDVKTYYGDITDLDSLFNVLKKVKPDEIYNLAAQTHVGISWEIPVYTSQATGVGTLNLLEAVRMLGLNSRIYHASTSELFSGKKTEAPFNENSILCPNSPYSVAKLFAHEICRVYREAYGMYISRGILFNHESPRRGENFVTRKITIGIANILKGKQKKIHLGNLDAIRDWGNAQEYTESMIKILQLDKPDDFVISTGQMYSIKDFLEEAFKVVNLNWKEYVEIDNSYVRPLETEYLCGDSLKAQRVLDWKPKTTFKELVKSMVESDIKL